MQQIFNENLKMLIINYIYKINKYKMFLFIIVDNTNMNIIFYIEFCFIKRKHFIDYI